MADSLDPGSVYVNATGYPASQISPSTAPKCAVNVFLMAKLELRPGFPFIGSDYNWQPAVKVQTGDSLLFDMPCGAKVKSQFVGEIYFFIESTVLAAVAFRTVHCRTAVWAICPSASTAEGGVKLRFVQELAKNPLAQVLALKLDQIDCAQRPYFAPLTGR